MRIFQFKIAFFVAVIGFLLSGCSTTISLGRPQQQTTEPDTASAQSNSRVNFNDPLLNSRKILLFGPIDQRTAEIAIQKLLFLDSKGHDPIDLFLETPGGELKYAWAVLQAITLIHSPVNTYALSDCNSGGAMLLAGGTGKRRAIQGAVIVIHGLKPGVGSEKPPATLVTDLQDSYTDFWRKRTNLPQSLLPLPLDSLHILTAEQALKYGIVDEVIDKSDGKPPKTAMEATPAAP